jgi:predicted lipoprotein with Yx(FWY)xxD motif
MRNRSLVLSYGAIAVACGLALAACGSSSSKTSSGATTTVASGTTPSTAAAGQEPVVKTKTDSKLGTILADASGKTLYTLTNGGQAVACTAQCSTVWPPLVVPAGVTTPTGGPGVTGLGVATAPDGTRLVTAGNLPLYRFARDTGASDANGEGIQSFGGVWHVVKVGGAATPSSVAPASTSRSGNGY